ncbi:hypothetical protein RZN05_11435 [Sphingomonas sp. HF-S4]|uniref:Uncharacterized protein n=1 Tax=Sphingomonas agrestis TaxID=3080540 RepID=A0ABU3Y8U6_9SPHN|nr:hypothetical protein [Sphingomonas sp. HF-S4]MDV3457598.1 hypothetical protein [Sphingomonas sp. HF-S4]
MRKQRGCGAASPASFGGARRRGARALLAGAVALLAGCGDSGGEPDAAPSVVMLGNENELIVPRPAVANVAEVAVSALNLAPDGLALREDVATRPLRFGMARDAVTQAVAGAIGAPIEQGDSQECGAGPLAFASFRDGLGLYFQDGKFAGWDLDGRDGGGLVTAEGIGIGSTRKQLEAARKATVEDSTLGIEFAAGGISGLLSMRDPSGEITNLWAGATCIAR